MTTARDLLRRQLRVAHEVLESTIAPVLQAAADPNDAGPAARAAACYAETLVSEDLIVNGVLSPTRPLALTSWCGRTGISELPWPAARDREAWLRRVRVDLPRVRAYAQAVRTATDAYVRGLPDESRDPEPAWLLTALLLDLAARRGEIGCLLQRPGVTGR